MIHFYMYYPDEQNVLSELKSIQMTCYFVLIDVVKNIIKKKKTFLTISRKLFTAD